MAARRPVAALIALSVGVLAYVTGEALPIGLLLSMAADLEVPATRVGLLVTAYGAVVVLATIPLTVLTRTVPRRPLLSVLLSGFVATTVIAALADSFWLVLAMRMVGAATQALFWAVVVPTAAGLFRPELRGRAVAVVFAGSTVGLAAALPAATWLGQIAGWRVAFLALSVVGLAAFATVAAVLPPSRADEGHAARGAVPDSRRYWLLVIVATLGTTGALVTYTYITTFVTEVSGMAADSMPVVLLARGVASLAGIAIVATIVDRWPRSVLTWTVAVQAAALLGLSAWGRGAIAAVVLFSLAGLAFAALTAAMGGRVLEVAPGRSDLAAAGVSTAVNVGISAGALVGGLLLSGYGVRSTALVGGLITALALALAILEQRPAVSLLVGAGARCAEGGAEGPEHEAEHGKDAEAEEQGTVQVHAHGGHQFAVERPAVDRVATQRLGQPDGVGERHHGGHGPDGGLQARADRPAGPARHERRDDEDGERTEHEYRGEQDHERERGFRRFEAVQQQGPGREPDRSGGAEVRGEPVGAQPPWGSRGDPQATGQHGGEIHRRRRRQVLRRGRLPVQEDHGCGDRRCHATSHQQGRRGYGQPKRTRAGDG